VSGPGADGRTRIEAVLFDIDRTLLDHDHAAAAALEAALEREDPSLGPEQRRRAAAEWSRLEALHYEDYLGGRISLHEQRRRRVRGLLAALGVPERDPEALDEWFDAFLRSYREAWRLFDDVAPALERLGKRAAGSITNADATLQHAKLAALGLDRRLPTMVASSAVGVAKPHAAIFRTAARELGLPAERIAYVGDRLDTDARGARDAGMLGIWLDREEGPVASDVPTIRTLAELDAIA
jgi:putative hydrolase of the HAD superfamily